MPHLARDPVGPSKVADNNTFRAKLVQARPARRCRRTQAYCSQLPRIQLDENNEKHNGLPGLRAIAVVTALVHVIAAGEAQAWGPSWRPRRHHRRINERSIDVKSFFQVCQSCHMKQARYTVLLRYTQKYEQSQTELSTCRRERCMSAWRPAHSKFSNRCAAASVYMGCNTVQSVHAYSASIMQHLNTFEMSEQHAQDLCSC